MSNRSVHPLLLFSLFVGPDFQIFIKFRLLICLYRLWRVRSSSDSLCKHNAWPDLDPTCG